jgi:nitrite reductase/ring-hydroxylating ferredoxin subunit
LKRKIQQTEAHIQGHTPDQLTARERWISCCLYKWSNDKVEAAMGYVNSSKKNCHVKPADLAAAMQAWTPSMALPAAPDEKAHSDAWPHGAFRIALRNWREYALVDWCAHQNTQHGLAPTGRLLLSQQQALTGNPHAAVIKANVGRLTETQKKQMLRWRRKWKAYVGCLPLGSYVSPEEKQEKAGLIMHEFGPSNSSFLIKNSIRNHTIQNPKSNT